MAHKLLHLDEMAVLCHNHPSRNVSPSEADTEAAQHIKESGKLIGLPLTDHIVIGGSGSKP